MKKTKIEFKDIQAGDLIQVVDKVHGVKWELTGIAFELADLGQGDLEWRTSQGGSLVGNDDPDTIWRIDARVSSFDDIQQGDLIQVTATPKDAEVVLTGVAHHRDGEGTWHDAWKTEQGEILVHRLTSVDEKIIILERNEQ